MAKFNLECVIDGEWRIGFADLTLQEARGELTWCRAHDPRGLYRLRIAR
jgi:hypothetical protein